MSEQKSKDNTLVLSWMKDSLKDIAIVTYRLPGGIAVGLGEDIPTYFIVAKSDSHGFSVHHLAAFSNGPTYLSSITISGGGENPQLCREAFCNEVMSAIGCLKTGISESLGLTDLTADTVSLAIISRESFWPYSFTHEHGEESYICWEEMVIVAFKSNSESIYYTDTA